MFKILLSLLFATAYVSECTVIKIGSYIPEDEYGLPNNQFMRPAGEITSNLGSHIMDFLNMLDTDKMTKVAIQYTSDPEVLMFMKFLLSPQFKDLIWEFEMMEEFKEAFAFLESKGYDMESVINVVNTALNLPSFEKPNVLRTGKGISGFLEAMVGTLPLEDMKNLFESKLQTSPEIADLFEIINSEEFLDIMRRMRQNPKFTEFKMIFEGYGFDFEFTCKWIKEFFGNYYQGIFCE